MSRHSSHSPSEQADAKALRQFGWTFGGVIALVFGLVIPWIWGLAWPRWPWITGAGFAVWAWWWPVGLGPVFRAWMRLAQVLGWVNTRILLGLVFYGLVLPIGAAMRLLGHDPLRRRKQAECDSYRVESPRPRPDHLEKPY